MEAVFRPELRRTRKRENPASSLYWILSGSKRDPSGKPAGNQRFPSEPGRKKFASQPDVSLKIPVSEGR